MAGKSDYLENEVLDHVLGGGDYTRPATVYLAFFTAAPTDAGGGTECTGGNYSRTAITNNATNFPAASGGAKSNGTEILTAVSSGAWSSGSNIVAWGLYDASSNGNLLYWNTMTATAIDGANQQIRVPVGDLDFTED